MKTLLPNGYKVSGRVLIPNGTGPRKAYLLRPGYLARPITTFWHKNGAVARLLPHILKTDYNPTNFTWRQTLKSEGKRYRETVWPACTTYKLASHADGGYPLIYHTADGCELCAKCATEQVTQRGLDWPRVVDVQPYFEGPAITCDNCSTDIESAYGEPDATDDQAQA